MLKKLALVAAVALSAFATAGSASATAYDFVIFANNTSVQWNRTSQSMVGGTWATLQPATNPAGGLKSGYYTAPNKAYTSYQAGWTVDPVHAIDASCSFWSYAQQNSFGNMQFYSGSSKSGVDSAPVTCSTSTPGSNLDGSYDFNYGVSGL